MKRISSLALLSNEVEQFFFYLLMCYDGRKQWNCFAVFTNSNFKLDGVEKMFLSYFSERKAHQQENRCQMETRQRSFLLLMLGQDKEQDIGGKSKNTI